MLTIARVALNSMQGAVVTCLAKGGPADRNGAVQIGDTIVSVDDLDVRDLMNNVKAHDSLILSFRATANQPIAYHAMATGCA